MQKSENCLLIGFRTLRNFLEQKPNLATFEGVTLHNCMSLFGTGPIDDTRWNSNLWWYYKKSSLPYVLELRKIFIRTLVSLRHIRHHTEQLTYLYLIDKICTWNDKNLRKKTCMVIRQDASSFVILSLLHIQRLALVTSLALVTLTGNGY